MDIRNDFAVVVVSALDGESIRDSRRVLVSTSARAQWSGMEFDEARGVITKSGTPPFLMEPVIGSVTIRPGRPVAVYRLSSSGQRLGKVIAAQTAEGVTFDLRPANRCMHYEIVR